MKNDREQANILRKTGLSYTDIKSRLGIPRSTLSTWFKDQDWSNEVARNNIRKVENASQVRLAVMNTVRGVRLKNLYAEARQDAIADFEELKYHPLFVAGTIEYRAHGDMTAKNKVSFTSSDPDSVRIFVLFLQRICSIEALAVRLSLHSGADEEKLRQFWVEKCGFKYEYFRKSVLRMQNKRQNPEDMGICNVIVNSAYLKSKILKWIELLTEEVCTEKYLEITP